MKSGLKPAEWREVQAESYSYLETAVTSVTPFTSLSANALAHLRDSWISSQDEYLRISIPAKDACNQYKMTAGWGSSVPMSRPRKEPCRTCSDGGQTNGFENLNTHPDTESEREQVTLHRDLAEPAVEFIERVFNAHGRSELGVSPRSLIGAARHVLERSSEGCNYTTLKRTAPVIYAHYGLSKQEIAEVTAYSESSVRQIVGKTDEVAFDRIGTTAFLKSIYNEEPVTVQRLMDLHDLTSTPVRNRLEELKQEGRVTSKNQTSGPPAATWKTVKGWNEPFVCSECDYTTHSLGGIRTHKVEKHG